MQAMCTDRETLYIDRLVAGQSSIEDRPEVLFDEHGVR